MAQYRDTTRPLQHILETNSKSLKADLIQFAQMDESLNDIPIHIGHDDFTVNFEKGDVGKNGFVFEGSLTMPDHSKQKVRLVKAKASGDEVEFEFLQDVDLQGNAKTYSYKPTSDEKKEYNSLRNSMFNELHSLITTQYSGVNSAKLIRKKFKSDLE